MGVRFLTSSGVGPSKNKKYPSQIPFKRKMKDDIIIHSVMFLAFMALIAQGHGSKEGEAKKETSDYSGHHGGGYGPSRGYGGGYKFGYGGGYKSGYGGFGPHYGGGYGGHKSHFGGYGGYKSGYGHGGYGHSYGSHEGYGHYQGYGYGSPFGGYGGSAYGGSSYGNLLGGHGGHEDDKDQEHKNTEAYQVPEFDHSYVDGYINKVHDYTDLQDDYKTDTLNVKVNWDLQDGKYGYLKSQYGIYPQLQPHYGYGIHHGGYGGHSYGGYGKSHYGGGYGGRKHYGGGYGGYGGGYGYGGKSQYGGASGYGGGNSYGGASGYGGYQTSQSDGSKDDSFNQDGHQFTDENQE